MAKSRRRSKKSSAPRGKSVKIGGRMYKCRARRVKKPFGHKGKTVRAFCRRAKKS